MSVYLHPPIAGRFYEQSQKQTGFRLYVNTNLLQVYFLGLTVKVFVSPFNKLVTFTDLGFPVNCESPTAIRSLSRSASDIPIDLDILITFSGVGT